MVPMKTSPNQPIATETLTWASFALGLATAAFLPVPELVGIATTATYAHIITASAAFFSAAYVGGRLGRPVAAAHVIMVTMTFSVAVSAYLYGGLRPWLVIAFPIAPIAGGALLGRRAAIQYTVAHLAVLAVVVPLQLLGHLPQYQVPAGIDVINTAATAVMGCALAAAITWQWTTAIERREQSLAQTRDIAVRADAAKTRFLASMSHEIRTPLNGVLGMAEVLLDGDLEARQREQVETIHRSGALLLRVLNDVLDLAKIEAGEVNIVHREFAVRESIESVLAVYRDLASRKGLTLDCRFDDEVPHAATGDEGRIAQMLGNLLNNAIKFTDTGSVDVEVSAPQPDQLRITVTDTGVGMDARTLESAFDRFRQGDDSDGGGIKGTGLGLAITRDLAMLLGGSVTARSAPGDGSVFQLDVPVTDVRTEKMPPPAARERTRYATTSSSRTRAQRAVLVAEDDLVSGEVIIALLAGLGYTKVTVVTDGEQAVDACCSGEFACVLMDGQMPMMNGMAATLAIREQDANIPIIGLTASALSQDHQRYLEAGMNEVLTKPVGRPALNECLARWLETPTTSAQS